MGSAGSTTLPLTQKYTTLRIRPSVGVGLQGIQCQHPTLSLPLGRVALSENWLELFKHQPAASFPTGG